MVEKSAAELLHSCRSQTRGADGLRLVSLSECIHKYMNLSPPITIRMNQTQLRFSGISISDQDLRMSISSDTSLLVCHSRTIGQGGMYSGMRRKIPTGDRRIICQEFDDFLFRVTADSSNKTECVRRKQVKSVVAVITFCAETRKKWGKWHRKVFGDKFCRLWVPPSFLWVCESLQADPAGRYSLTIDIVYV